VSGIGNSGSEGILCLLALLLAMFDPTSLPKMERMITSLRTNLPAPPSEYRLLSHFSPNLLEVKELYGKLQQLGLFETEEWFAYIAELRLSANWRNGIERLSNIKEHDLGWLVNAGVAQMMVSLLPWVENLWIKCGQDGLIHLGIVDAAREASRGQAGVRRVEHDSPNDFKDFAIGQMEKPVLRLSHYSPIKLDRMVSSTGAGDSLVGGLIAGLGRGLPIDQVARQGMDAARASLLSDKAVGDVKRLE
jgi:pseudouridine-5'-phosphate glycosidase/pseudouridine kinase